MLSLMREILHAWQVQIHVCPRVNSAVDLGVATRTHSSRQCVQSRDPAILSESVHRPWCTNREPSIQQEFCSGSGNTCVDTNEGIEVAIL